MTTLKSSIFQFFLNFKNPAPLFLYIKNIQKIIQKFSKNYWTKGSNLTEALFDWMKSWLDIKKKGGNQRKTILLTRLPPWSQDRLIADGIDNFWSSLLRWTTFVGKRKDFHRKHSEWVWSLVLFHCLWVNVNN